MRKPQLYLYYLKIEHENQIDTIYAWYWIYYVKKKNLNTKAVNFSDKAE